MYTFSSTTGWLCDATGKRIAQGYAGGECGKRPDAVNNPDMESVPQVGPLPRGIYSLGDPVEHSRLGPYAIPLIPDSENEMYGRSGFFVHGDTIPSGNASEGCIILPRFAREALKNSGERIQVC
jgi:hypothetical protein